MTTTEIDLEWVKPQIFYFMVLENKIFFFFLSTLNSPEEAKVLKLKRSCVSVCGCGPLHKEGYSVGTSHGSKWGP